MSIRRSVTFSVEVVTNIELLKINETNVILRKNMPHKLTLWVKRPVTDINVVATQTSRLAYVLDLE